MAPLLFCELSLRAYLPACLPAYLPAAAAAARINTLALNTKYLQLEREIACSVQLIVRNGIEVQGN